MDPKTHKLFDRLFPGLSYRAAACFYYAGFDTIEKVREIMKLPYWEIKMKVRNFGMVSYQNTLKFLNQYDQTPAAQLLTDQERLDYLKGKKITLSTLRIENGTISFKIVSIE